MVVVVLVDVEQMKMSCVDPHGERKKGKKTKNHHLHPPSRQLTFPEPDWADFMATQVSKKNLKAVRELPPIIRGTLNGGHRKEIRAVASERARAVLRVLDKYERRPFEDPCRGPVLAAFVEVEKVFRESVDLLNNLRQVFDLRSPVPKSELVCSLSSIKIARTDVGRWDCGEVGAAAREGSPVEPWWGQANLDWGTAAEEVV